MNSPQTSFKSLMNLPNLRTSLSFAALTLLSACSVFGGRADPVTRDAILAAVPIGMPLEAAESSIADHGFSCLQHHGSFIDDDGRDHDVGHYLGCIKPPSFVSFQCLYRDQVYVVAKDNIVSEIYVARGPSCITQ